MDFIDQPKAFTPKKAGKKKPMAKESPFLSGNFMDAGSNFDIGLDLGKVANQGISLNYGTELGLSSPISNKGWGFEDYVARDFGGYRQPRLKTPKSERRYRTIDYNESPEIYGMESFTLYSAQSEKNLGKSRKALAKNVGERIQLQRDQYSQEGTILDYGRKKLVERKAKRKYFDSEGKYEAEPVEEKDNSAEAFGSEAETYDDYPDSPKQKTRREYFPDYDEGIGQRGSPNEPYEGEMRIQRNKRGLAEGIKRRIRW